MKITFVPFSMQFLYMLIPCRRTGGGGNAQSCKNIYW